MQDFTPTRPSAVARRKKEQRAELIKDCIAVAVALPILWATITLSLLAF